MKLKGQLIFIFQIAGIWAGSMLEVMAQNANLAQTNIQYIYDKQAPVFLDNRVAMGENEATVFLRVELKENTGNQPPTLRYEIRNDYINSNILGKGTLGKESLMKQEENVFFYRFVVPVEENAHYIFAYVRQNVQGTDMEFRFDISLETDTSFPLTGLVTMREAEDIPIFKNYIEQHEPFRIVSLYKQLPQAYIYYYSHSFAPNPPPTAVRGAEAQQTLSIDSLFSVSLDTPLDFSHTGLYFVQTDTTSLSGISFRICDRYYPRLVTAGELIEPLRYISTSEEMEQMEENEDKKAALDKYWVKVTRSQERAKLVIRDYYRQVTEANRLFTTYKEGWKTGQGMVFVLYGTPDRVFREGQREVWVYNADKELIDLTFTFAKIKNIYTDKHYNLVPDEDYKKFWYRNIDLWRKGRKALQ